VTASKAQVEQLLRAQNFDPAQLEPDWIAYWLSKGLDANEIVAIAISPGSVRLNVTRRRDESDDSG
jgi:hypothetical protein